MELTKDVRTKVREIAEDGYRVSNRFFNTNQFNQELNNFFMTKKMVSRFLKLGTINEKLLINNVVIALNSFGVERTNVIFRLICNDVQFSMIKAILLFLRSYHPDVGDDVYPNRIMVDILRDIQLRYNLDHL